jgi:hypothetical protein
MVLLVLVIAAQAVRRELDPEDRVAAPPAKNRVPPVAEWVPIVYVFAYAAFVVVVQSMWPRIRDKVLEKARDVVTMLTALSVQATRWEILSKKASIFVAKQAAAQHNNPDEIVQCFKHEREVHSELHARHPFASARCRSRP